MKFALLVTGGPFQSKACHSALSFAKAIIAHPEHELIGVFFYEDAVLVANQLNNPPRDEMNITHSWQQLAQTSGVELKVCIAAAIRRGILNEAEATRHEQAHHNLASGFTLEGLGTLIELEQQADRLVRFRP